MKQITTTWGLRIGLSLLWVIGPAARLHAQNVIFDGTLGVAGAAPTVRAPTPGYRSRYNILQKSGATVSNNLFHSFKQFKLAIDEEAAFGSDRNVRNILVRITGNEISDIQGRILTNQVNQPNLFLINPNGIYFGSNARMDNIGIDNLSGAFFATTVDAIQFPNGEFSAIKPLGPESLLTIVGDPSGFMVSQRQPGAITVATRNRFPSAKEINGLAVSGGQNLLLLGGEVLFAESSLRTVGEAQQGLQAQTEGIHFQVVSVLGPGIMTLQRQSDRWTLNVPDSIAKGNVSLKNSKIYIGARTGGSLQITANNLIATDSQLALAVTGGSNLPMAQGGDVQLKMTSSLQFDQSIVSSEVVEGGKAQGGNITLTAPQLISRDSQIRADSFGNGNAGNLTVIAPQLIDLSGDYRSPADPNDLNSGPGGLFSQVNKNALGKGGNLSIDTSLLRIQDGSKVQTAVFGEGAAGTITIRAQEIDIAETERPNYFPTEINTGVSRTLFPSIDERFISKGPGGELILETDRLKIQGGSVTAASFGQGNSGNITIKGYKGKSNAELIEVTNSPLELKWPEGSISATNEGIGQAGNLTINADRLVLKAGKIQTRSRLGDGGDINIQAKDALLLRQSSSISTTAGTAGAGGNGGNVTINAPKGFLITLPNENNDITANAFNGRGGKVDITAKTIYQFTLRSRDQLIQLLGSNDLDPSRLITNDITAIAQNNPTLNGSVTLNSPDVDPSRGLAQLPTAPTDPSNRIDQTCAPNTSVSNRFTIAGQGGLPPDPKETLFPNNTLPRLATAPTIASPLPKATVKAQAMIVEAQAAVRFPHGKIRLVAQAPESSLYANISANCRTR